MRNFNLKNKPAFTMIELVFVIVVLAILAALALPRMERDLTHEAADSILSDIRYTQQLAMNDFKHSIVNQNWQKSFWRIGFNGCGGTNFYEYIGSDLNRNGGQIANTEAAIDPSNGRRMVWNGPVVGSPCPVQSPQAISPRIFISNKYGIRAVATAGGCAAAQYIGFDHLGRPHTGFAGAVGVGAGDIPNYASYMNQACTFTFTMADNITFRIIIQPETGYAQIVGQDNS